LGGGARTTWRGGCHRAGLDSERTGGIDATVVDGWVNLEGTVGFRFQKQAAENAGRRLIGLRGVENNLVVATAQAARDIKTSIGAAIQRSLAPGVRDVIDEVGVEP